MATWVNFRLAFLIHDSDSGIARPSLRSGLLMRFAALLLAFTLAACSSSSFEPTRAHDVLVTLTVPGPCVSGLCDPAGNNSVLGLISVVNHGTAIAYLPTCGTVLDFGTQQFESGQWVNVGPADACVFPSTPVALARGDSMRTNGQFTAGRWRLLISVSTTAAMGDPVEAISNGVTVF